jgi:hypothetical protein
MNRNFRFGHEAFVGNSFFEYQSISEGGWWGLQAQAPFAVATEATRASSVDEKSVTHYRVSPRA